MKFLFKGVKASSCDCELKYEPLDDEITEEEIQSYEDSPNGEDDIGEVFDDVGEEEQGEMEERAGSGPCSGNLGKETECTAPNKNGHNKYII